MCNRRQEKGEQERFFLTPGFQTDRTFYETFIKRSKAFLFHPAQTGIFAPAVKRLKLPCRRLTIPLPILLTLSYALAGFVKKTFR